MSYKDQYDEAKKVGGLEGLTPSYLEFDKKGKEIIGRYVTSSDVQGSIGEGTYKQYVFDTDEGLIKCAMGKATDREVHPQLIEGDVYRIVFEGKVSISGKRHVNKFTVEHLAGDSVTTPGKEEEIPF